MPASSAPHGPLTRYAHIVATLRENDRAASRDWEALARERSTGWRSTIRRNRALRTIGGLQDRRADSAAPTSAAQQMTDTRKRRAARAEVAEVARRDAIERADCYPLDPVALVERAASAIEYAVPRATDDERSDALSYVLYRVVQAHGPEPLSADVSPRWLERLASGRVLNERHRAGRFDALADERDERDEHRREDADERRAAAGRNVWADAGGMPVDADGGAGALRAIEVSADALSDALARVTLRPVHPSSALAIGAALNGYGSGAEMAAALALSEGTARKRLHDGRAKLRADYPTPDALADALALALSTIDSERVRLTSPQRAALAMVNAARRVTARTAAAASHGSHLPTR